MPAHNQQNATRPDIGLHHRAPEDTVAQARAAAGPGRLLAPPALPRRRWLLVLCVRWTRPLLPQQAAAEPATSTAWCGPCRCALQCQPGPLLSRSKNVSPDLHMSSVHREAAAHLRFCTAAAGLESFCGSRCVERAHDPLHVVALELEDVLRILLLTTRLALQRICDVTDARPGGSVRRGTPCTWEH